MQRLGVTVRCSVLASHCSGFFCCGAWALGCAGSVAVARGLCCPMARGIFPTMDQTHILCIGRQILIHCATRKVPEVEFLTRLMVGCIE